MLNFFHSLRRDANFAIRLIAVLFFLPTLLFPPVASTDFFSSIGLDWFLNHSQLSIYLPILFAFLLLMGFSITIMRLNRQMVLIDRQSYLPMLIYTLLIGAMPATQLFQIAHIAVILLWLAILTLLHSLDDKSVNLSPFISSILVSTAVFFYPESYYFMLVIWIALLFGRTFYFREWIYTLIGYLLPLYLVFSYHYIFNNNPLFVWDFYSNLALLSFQLVRLSYPEWLLLGGVFLFLLLSIPLLRYFSSTSKIVVRRAYYILYATFFVSLFLCLFTPNGLSVIWYITACPLAFLLTVTITQIHKKRLASLSISALILLSFIVLAWHWMI